MENRRVGLLSPREIDRKRMLQTNERLPRALPHPLPARAQ
jgi:hypothetical protein